MEENKELKGIGGWLKFFIICIMYVSPAFMFISTIAIFNFVPLDPLVKYHDGWKSYEYFSYVMMFVYMAIQYRVGFKLKNKLVPQSVHHAKLMVVILPITMVMLDYIASMILLDMQYEFINDIFKAIIYSIVWYLYFTRSIRVKNTYFKDRITETINE